jgi:hypothetical protein
MTSLAKDDTSSVRLKNWSKFSCFQEMENNEHCICNLLLCLEHAILIFKEINIPVVTLSLLLEWHQLILPGSNGLRTGQVFTSYAGKLHMYPNHNFLDVNLTCICDFLNRQLFELISTKQVTFETLASLASLVAFNLLSLHPFSDGNGRLTRIVIAYIMFMSFEQPAVIQNWVPTIVDIREKCNTINFPVWNINVDLLKKKIYDAYIFF